MSILINGSATNYRHLWNTFKDDLMDDLIVQADKSDPNHLLICEKNAIRDIHQFLSLHNKSLFGFSYLPRPKSLIIKLTLLNISQI